MLDRAIPFPTMLLTLVIGSGLYVVVPASSYLVVAMALFALCSNAGFRTAPIATLGAGRMAGTWLLLALFLIHSMFHPLEPRAYLAFANAMVVALLGYACWKRMLDVPMPRERRVQLLILVVCIGGMLLLLAGQIAETMGYIDRRSLASAEREQAFALRPGGFHNPNMTGAIALALLFAMYRANVVEHGNLARRLLMLVGLTLATVVVLLAQSRACLAVLVGFTAWVIWFRHPSFAIALVVAALTALVVVDDATESVSLLVERTSERFRSDQSNDDRARVLKVAIEAIGDSPLVGNGYRYVQRVADQSSHNEVIEHLANFGFSGLLVAALAFVLLHLPASPTYLIVCVLPTLMFSHNFFDNASLQTVLGLALAADRRWGPKALAARDRAATTAAAGPAARATMTTGAN